MWKIWGGREELYKCKVGSSVDLSLLASIFIFDYFRFYRFDHINWQMKL